MHESIGILVFYKFDLFMIIVNFLTVQKNMKIPPVNSSNIFIYLIWPLCSIINFPLDVGK